MKKYDDRFSSHPDEINIGLLRILRNASDRAPPEELVPAKDIQIMIDVLDYADMLSPDQSAKYDEENQRF